jgi:hypothetical protein
MPDEAITRRLDKLIAILQLAHADAIGRTREEIRQDEVKAALLDQTDSTMVGVGELKRGVAKKTNQSEKTVQRRIGDLISLGALEVEGSGKSARYRSTGLI